jgi:hypothetical protein
MISAAVVLHLLTYCILPNIFAILFLKFHTVIPTLSDFNSKLVGLFVTPLGHIIKDTAALLEHIWDPSQKSRGIMQVLGDIMLSNFHRIDFLDLC